jgi:RND family efflux transporter MFP subunit
MKIRHLFTLAISLLSSLIASSAIASSAEAQEIEFVAAKRIQLDSKVVLNGHVEAINESTVSAQVNAKVKKIYVDVDDQVAVGKVLIELDDTELKAQLAKANASLNVAKANDAQAKSEFKRLKGLAADSFVSQNDITKASSAVDVANANISLAKAQISEVKQQLSYTTIIAPYSGVVTARHIEVGETANFGQPLLTGFALNQNTLIVHVPNYLIKDVEATKTLLAQTSDGSWKALTNLTIAPNLDTQTHTILVRANINKDDFNQRPGSFIKVAVKTDPRSALVVPMSAVFNQGDLSAVYVKLDDTYALRQVLLGEKFMADKNNQVIEILSGLSVIEQVATNGAKLLSSESE